MREPHAKPFGAEGERLMRRPLTLLATVAILIGLVAAPAAADKPTEIVWPLITYEGWDPCTGEVMTETIQWIGNVHSHRNNVVETAKVTGFTSTGYVMLSSPDVVMINGNVLMTVYNKRWIRPDGDDRRHTSRRILIKNYGPDPADWDIRMWTDRNWCTSGPTIPQPITP
jgi:hypothetical protein